MHSRITAWRLSRYYAFSDVHVRTRLEIRYCVKVSNLPAAMSIIIRGLLLFVPFSPEIAHNMDSVELVANKKGMCPTTFHISRVFQDCKHRGTV